MVVRVVAMFNLKVRLMKYVYQLFLVIIVFGVAGNLALIPFLWPAWGDDFIERFFILQLSGSGLYVSYNFLILSKIND